MPQRPRTDEERRAAREERFRRRAAAANPPVDPLADASRRRAAARAGGAAPAPEDWRAGVMTASALSALAGIWLIIAPFVLGYQGGDPSWNDIVFGAIVLVLALTRMLGDQRRSWPSLVTCAIGAWIFISAFVLDDSGRAAGNDIILGVVVFVLGALSAVAGEEGQATDAARPPRARRRR